MMNQVRNDDISKETIMNEYYSQMHSMIGIFLFHALSQSDGLGPYAKYPKLEGDEVVIPTPKKRNSYEYACYYGLPNDVRAKFEQKARKDALKSGFASLRYEVFAKYVPLLGELYNAFIDKSTNDIKEEFIEDAKTKGWDSLKENESEMTALIKKAIAQIKNYKNEENAMELTYEMYCHLMQYDAKFWNFMGSKSDSDWEVTIKKKLNDDDYKDEINEWIGNIFCNYLDANIIEFDASSNLLDYDRHLSLNNNRITLPILSRRKYDIRIYRSENNYYQGVKYKHEPKLGQSIDSLDLGNYGLINEAMKEQCICVACCKPWLSDFLLQCNEQSCSMPICHDCANKSYQQKKSNNASNSDDTDKEGKEFLDGKIWGYICDHKLKGEIEAIRKIMEEEKDTSIRESSLSLIGIEKKKDKPNNTKSKSQIESLLSADEESYDESYDPAEHTVMLDEDAKDEENKHIDKIEPIITRSMTNAQKDTNNQSNKKAKKQNRRKKRRSKATVNENENDKETNTKTTSKPKPKPKPKAKTKSKQKTQSKAKPKPKTKSRNVSKKITGNKRKREEEDSDIDEELNQKKKARTK